MALLTATAAQADAWNDRQELINLEHQQFLEEQRHTRIMEQQQQYQTQQYYQQQQQYNRVNTQMPIVEPHDFGYYYNQYRH